MEFFGVPGAGKSTVAHHVGQRLAADGYSVAEPTYTLVHDRTRIRRYLAKMGYAVSTKITPETARKARVEKTIVTAAADEPTIDIVRVRNETSVDLERSTAELYQALTTTLA